ncbi:hypothetical protein [Georgfuchsia toluolica]|uniref:hypothetical protein n=1 Tax=Georgfuchsia toluolica TaxID=424218 RepID=UPI001C73699E|nr:hypothetical protein [Georgfuchsia toluolica]
MNAAHRESQFPRRLTNANLGIADSSRKLGRNNVKSISTDAVLKLFRQDAFLDLRKLAVQLGVDTANSMLAAVIGNLVRKGIIRRLGGKGRHTLFVLATFEG